MTLDQNISYNVLAPGPVNLHPLVQKALAMPMIHHRTPQFDQIFAFVRQKLKSVFQTSQDVYILSSTGSGGMEALLVNTLNPGEKVIAVVSGKFGERWAEMAQVIGCHVIIENVPWGQALSPLRLKDILALHPDAVAVLCQACETSTAVAHPLKELSDIIQTNSKALFLVDGITAAAAYSIPMDDWKIDGLVAGSQKAFMLPTGLSFVALSSRAWKKVETTTTPRFYFDLRKEKVANQKGESFFSSSVTLIRALDVVLDLILENGLEHHFEVIRHRSLFVKTFIPQLGMPLYSQAPSDSLTAVLLPENISGQKIRDEIEGQYHITVMGGQDQLKGRVLRIGHMGYIQAQDCLDLLKCLQEISQKHWPDKVKDFDFKAQTAKASEWLKNHKVI